MIYKHMNGANLQDWYHITIKQVQDGTEYGSKQVTFHSRIHVNKANTCPVTYSAAYSDLEILSDRYFVQWVNACYGEVAA